MAIRLYSYQFKERSGLILQNGDGWGEITPLPGFSKETLEEALVETIHYLKTKTPPKLPSVRWGIQCAEKPYDSSAFSIPLCAFKIPFPGATHLKLKIGALSLEEAITLVSSYIGKFRLRLDCNQSWSLDKALSFARHFSPEDFDYMEEPVQNFDDLIQFSQKTFFPIGVDESFRKNLPVYEIPTLAAVIVKPMLTGEIPKLVSPIPLVLSSSFETSLGILHIARRASFPIPHGLHTFKEDLLFPPLKAENGHLHIFPHSINTTKLCLVHSIP